MPKYTITHDGQIYKNYYAFDNCDVSWLPSDVLVVQTDGTTAETCTLEKGNRDTGERTTTEKNVATSSLSWWSNVDSIWTARYDELYAQILEADHQDKNPNPDMTQIGIDLSW